MGITVHYSGKFDELERIEEFEDRVLDMALDLGADAHIFRGFPTTSPTRVVRGLIVNLAAGQESLSLLVSPDGWLIPGYLLDLADLHNDTEPPWCSVKTQYGSLEGHILVVEVLDAIRKVFIKTLTVDDEAGYWERRDIGALAKRFRRNQFIIDSFARGLDKSTMREQSGTDDVSTDGTIDDETLVKHIQQLAERVHRAIQRPSEHAPVEFTDYDDWLWQEDSEAKWDAVYREHRRKQERLQRSILEQLADGEDHGDALKNALRNEGLVDLPKEDRFGEPSSDEEIASDKDHPANQLGDGAAHPLLKRATQLTLRINKLSSETIRCSPFFQTLTSAAGDLTGGLAQVFYDTLDEEPCQDECEPLEPHRRGWSITQLKRSLRGAALAQAALCALKEEKLIDLHLETELHELLKTLRDDVYAQLVWFRTGED